MNELERFLVTFDTARGVAVKVERVGEAGELTEVDLPGFVRSLSSGPPAGTPQQIVINIYGGGAQGPPMVQLSGEPPKGVHPAMDFPHFYPPKTTKEE